MIKGEKQRRNERAIKALAANIRRYRLERKMTIAELANAVGVDYSQVGRMERGVVNANVSMVFDVAQALGVPASRLLETDAD
ncbi:helix-turn-helix domain-containing protein [Mucilaginibacter sp. AW1-7]|uniref:helix-turn-helix domain-containing protein n=1 Tax=Mucilaginibacter sp. AW1-7 TaxID=3349874 RepID=UPI003F73BAB8